MAPMDQERRSQLFDAALPIFTRFGYRKTTIEEICREAGISKRTFYEEFTDKKDFFGRLCLNLATGFTLEWQEMTSEETSAARRIERYIDHYVASCTSTPVFAVIFENEESMAAVDEAFNDESCKPMCAALGASIEAGMASGEFRPMNAEITTMIVGTLMDALFCILPQLFKNSLQAPDGPFVDELKDFVVHGLLAR